MLTQERTFREITFLSLKTAAKNMKAYSLYFVDSIRIENMSQDHLLPITQEQNYFFDISFNFVFMVKHFDENSFLIFGK